MEVVGVDDHGVVPLPPQPGNYASSGSRRRTTCRTSRRRAPDLKPLEITQPEGPSFTVDGPRGRVAEVAVPGRLHAARGPRPARRRLRRRRHAAADPLPRLARGDVRPLRRPRADALLQERLRPGRVRHRLAGQLAGRWAATASARSATSTASSTTRTASRSTIENAICMHEEDFGIRWKHTDWRTERRRGPPLAAAGDLARSPPSATTSTASSGTSTRTARSSSRSSSPASSRPARCAPGERPRTATLVAPGLYAPHHQHFFSVRLDMAVDGDANTVVRGGLRAAAAPGRRTRTATPGSPSDAAGARVRGAAAASTRCVGRFWRIVNPAPSNALGDPVALQARPGRERRADVRSRTRASPQRAGFATEHLWVTPYDPAERYAAGDYPNQHPGGDGLPAYAAADRAARGHRRGALVHVRRPPRRRAPRTGR